MARYPLNPRWTPTHVEQALTIVTDTILLLPVRSAWTQGANARDRHSHPVCHLSPRAVRWCLTAALLRAEHDRFQRQPTWADEGFEYESMSRPLRLALETVGVTLMAVLHYEQADLDVRTELVALKGTDLAVARIRTAAILPRLQDDRGCRYGHIRRALLLSWVALDHRLKDQSARDLG